MKTNNHNQAVYLSKEKNENIMHLLLITEGEK